MEQIGRAYRVTLAVCSVWLVAAPACSRAQEQTTRSITRARTMDLQGIYFSKKEYVPSTLPTFEEYRQRLPAPVYDDDPLLVELYWKVWELAFTHFYEPPPGSGFVSQFIDAAFNENIFLWDTSFMTMFCALAQPLVPGITSLDNFYIKQHEDGEICREIVRQTGMDFAAWINKEDTTLFSRWGWAPENGQVREFVRYMNRPAPPVHPRLTLDALDHPIAAWAELENFRYTGDASRLRSVLEPLAHYYRSLQEYLRQGNRLYITDWASMDNSPRNPFLRHGGAGVDISSEMVLFARNLATIARLTGRLLDSKAYEVDAEELAARINALMWDDDRKFYVDLSMDGEKVPIKTIAAYWTLLAGVAPADRAALLVRQLKNPATFGRLHPVPTCSADEKGYDPDGGYWRGAVWAPTNTMVIRGLEHYGYDSLARDIAIRHLDAVAKVYKASGTVWENYAPDTIEPGRNADGSLVHRDFVGWSGIGPILYFMEFRVGLRPDAQQNRLRWDLGSHRRTGCAQYRFNGHVVSLFADRNPGAGATYHLDVSSDGPFTLDLHYGISTKELEIKPGTHEFTVSFRPRR